MEEVVSSNLTRSTKTFQTLTTYLPAEDVPAGIEASKIASHSTVRMTEEYTKIQLTRQEELTRRIQGAFG